VEDHFVWHAIYADQAGGKVSHRIARHGRCRCRGRRS
jgi:hypothetical protein